MLREFSAILHIQKQKTKEEVFIWENMALIQKTDHGKLPGENAGLEQESLLILQETEITGRNLSGFQDKKNILEQKLNL